MHHNLGRVHQQRTFKRHCSNFMPQVAQAQVLVSYLPGPLNAVKDSLADKAVIAGEEPRRSRSYLARSRDGCVSVGPR